MFKLKRLPTASVLLTAIALHCPAGHAEWVEWLADASVGGQFDSNVNHALTGRLQGLDYIGKLFLSAGRAYQLGDYSRAYLTAEWNGESHEHYSGLNQFSSGGKAVLTHKFGLGQQAPLLRLELADAEIFSASHLRSGNQLLAGLSVSSWCNDYLYSSVAYRFDLRRESSTGQPTELKPNNVFNMQGHTVEVGSSLVIFEHMQLTTGYSHRFGDVSSNNSPYSLSARSLSGVAAIAWDDAFPGWTYRSYGNTNVYNLGVSYGLLGGHAATALNYSYTDTDTVGLNYTSHQIQFSLHYSY